MPVLYQSVALDVDLTTDSIAARTSLVVCQEAAEEDVIRLHCRQLQIKKITVNDIETTYTLADGLSDLFPRRSTDGEDNNTVALGHNEKYLDKGVDGEGIDVSHRAALELARRGELVVDVPPQFCLSGPDNDASSHSNEESDDDDDDASSHSNEESEMSTHLAADPPSSAAHHTTDNVQSEDKPKTEDKPSTEAPVFQDTAPTAASALKVSTETETIGKTDDMDIDNTEEERADSATQTTIDPALYRSIQFLLPLPSGTNVSKSVAAKWKVLEAEIEQCIGRNGRVLKIEIEYIISDPAAGLAFRRGAGSMAVEGMAGRVVARLLSSSVGLHPSYGAGGGAGPVGGLSNVDGVRCWLPCCDNPQDRCIFDSSVRFSVSCFGNTPARSIPGSDGVLRLKEERAKSAYLKWLSKLSVLCSGVFIARDSDATACSWENGLTPIQYRYVTLQPIPACSLGIFVGAVQTHRSPVYGSTGFVCTEVSDHYLEELILSEEDSEVCDFEETWAALSHSLSQPLKDARQFQSFASSSTRSSALNSSLPQALQDTFLGLEQATRYLQRSLGKRFPHRQYVQIILSEIQGCASTWGEGAMASQFLAFDGFTMFQKHALCTSSLMPFLESTSHLTLVNGFITSWLSTAIAVRSYEDEFIVTGAIGYLLIDYVSYVYGEADGRVWLLKLYHSIVQLESQGASQGVPLVYSHADIPVGYELYSLANAALNRAKSIVFMHLLEHRIGHSAEIMKGRVLRWLLTCSPDFSNKHASIRLHRNLISANAGNSGNSGGVMFPPSSPQTAASPHPNHMPPPAITRPRAPSTSIFPPESPQPSASPHPNHRYDMAPPNLSKISAVSGIFPPESPQPNASPHPNHRFDMAPPNLSRLPSVPGGGAAVASIFPPESPQPHSSPHPNHRFDMAPPMLSRAMSTQSQESSMTTDKNGTIPPKEEKSVADGGTLITFTDPHSLLEICRSAAGGAVSDLEQDFLDRCLYSSGVVLVRLGAVLDRKNKKLECVAQQIAYSNNRIETEMTQKEKKTRRAFTSTMPYLFTKLDFHVVSGGEVWKYSRGLESHTQSISISIYTKPKKVGRKRLIDTLTASAASEATNYNDVTNLDEIEEAHIERSLTALQQVRATMFSESLQVSFVSVDPEMLYARACSMAAFPVSFAIEQLFTDGDEWGQLAAVLALGESPPRNEAIADTMLRITALTDCLKQACARDKTIESVTHHAFIRASAAFALARYQNAHAPKMTTADSLGSWLGLRSILNAYIQFYYIYPANYLSARQPATNSINGQIPGPFTLEDISSTYLRCAMLLALSSIKARSGATPYDVINLILSQAENIYSINSESSGSTSNKADDSAASASSFDDSHVCSVLMLAMSRIRVSTYMTKPGSKPSDKPTVGLCYTTLDRIRAIAEFYLERDLVFSVASREREENSETDATSGMPRVAGARRVETAAGGILTAAALQCLCETACQIHPVRIARPPRGVWGEEQRIEDIHPPAEDAFDYYQYLDNSKYSPLVRSAAVECILKLMIHNIADNHALKAARQNAMAGIGEGRDRSGSDIPIVGRVEERTAPYVASGADLLAVALFVIKSDPDVSVRRNTAQALLNVAQGISPLRMTYSAISLGSLGECFEWFDSSGFTALNAQHGMVFGQFKQGIVTEQSERSIEFSLSQEAFDIAKCVSNDTSDTMKTVVTEMRSMLARHKRVAMDQISRSTLFRVWLVFFHSDVPPVLQVEVEEEGILRGSDFQFLDSSRLHVPHPLHCLRDVHNLLTWGDQLDNLPPKAFSTVVPVDPNLARVLQKPDQPEHSRKVAQKVPATAVKSGGMLRIQSSGVLGGQPKTAGTITLKRPREDGPSPAPPTAPTAAPGVSSGNIPKKPRFRLGFSSSTTKLV